MSRTDPRRRMSWSWNRSNRLVSDMLQSGRGPTKRPTIRASVEFSQVSFICEIVRSACVGETQQPWGNSNVHNIMARSFETEIWNKHELNDEHILCRNRWISIQYIYTRIQMCVYTPPPPCFHAHSCAGSRFKVWIHKTSAYFNVFIKYMDICC